MKADLHSIALEPGESFTCVDWKVPDREDPSPVVFGFHLEYLLVAVIESRGMAYIGDHVGPFREGDIYLVGPRLPLCWRHHAKKSRPIRHIVTASFDEDFAGHAFQTPEANQIRQMLARSRCGILFPRSLSARIIPDLQRVSRLKGWARMTLFFDVLGRLAAARKVQPLASLGFSGEIDEKELGRLSVVCNYIHASYAEEIREKDAAALIGLSAVPFSRFFRRRMAKTFVSYVTEVRLNEACRRLVDTDLTIVQIAYESGFNNLSNFNRQFLRLKGLPPREYRSRHSEVLSAISLPARRKKPARVPARKK